MRPPKPKSNIIDFHHDTVADTKTNFPDLFKGQSVSSGSVFATCDDSHMKLTDLQVGLLRNEYAAWNFKPMAERRWDFVKPDSTIRPPGQKDYVLVYELDQPSYDALEAYLNTQKGFNGSPDPERHPRTVDRYARTLAETDD